MGAKVLAFLEFLLLIVLIISPQVAVARELTNSDSGREKGISYGPLNPKYIPKRKCNYKNKCSRPPSRPAH